MRDVFDGHRDSLDGCRRHRHFRRVNFIVGVLLCAFDVARASDLTEEVEPLNGFVANEGQWDSSIRFGARYNSTVLVVTADALMLSRVSDDSHFESVRLSPVGSNGPFTSTGERVLPTLHHFYLGADPDHWVRDARGFEQVRIAEFWPGADLIVRKSESGFHYDIDSKSNGARVFEFAYEGGDDAIVKQDGDLEIGTPFGRMLHRAPRAWATADLDRPVSARFVLTGDHRFAIAVEESSSSYYIDPGIEWSTLLGGTQFIPNAAQPKGTRVRTIKVLEDGSTLCGGETGHADFPITAGVLQSTIAGAPLDMFVTRLTADGGAIVFSTFIGGKFFSFPPGGSGIDTLAWLEQIEDEILVVGETGSPDFPSTPGALSTPWAFFHQAVALRLSVDGSTLLSSAKVGMGANGGGGVLGGAVDERSRIGIAGYSFGPGLLSTPNAHDPVFSGGSDGFIFVMSSDLGSLAYGTYVGGSSTDSIGRLVLCGDDLTFVGVTQSSDFPTTPGSFDTVKSGFSDSVIGRINVKTGSLQWSTFFGSSVSDGANDVELDQFGKIYVVGSTGVGSIDFPTTPGSLMSQPWVPDGQQGFVTCFTPNATGLVFSTLFGGVSIDKVVRVDIDDDGFVNFLGDSGSGNGLLQTTKGAYQENWQSSSTHLFVSRLLRDGRTLAYSTGFGGNGQHDALAFDAAEDGSITFATTPFATDYPLTPGAFDTQLLPPTGKCGVGRLDILPTGVTRIGASTAGCAGRLAAGVIQSPTAGAKNFELTCTRGPANLSGWLLIATQLAPVPISVLGASLYVDPATAVLVPVSTDEYGFTRTKFPLRASSLGTTACVQYVFQDPCAFGGISASTALEIVVQP